MNKDVLKYKFILLILLLALSGRTFAGERYEFYNGVRQLGMGGVSVATVNDETSLILNPAGLGKLRNKFLTVIDPEIGMSENVYDFFSDNDFDYSELISAQDILNTLIASPDEHYHLNAQLFPSFVMPNFGFGVLGSWSYDGEVVSDSSEFDVRYRNDLSVLLGYNIRLFDGRVKLGFSGRYINRAEVDTTVASTSTDLKWGTLVQEGTGLAADVGLLLTGPWTYLPTLGAVVRDVGNTSYSMGSGMLYDDRPVPDTTLQTIDVGFSVTPILAKNIRLQIAADYRDVLDSEEESEAIRRIHGGMELNIYDHIFLRGGYNQGYWTAGMELSFQFIQVQLASYGEEIGDVGGDAKEDRRYVFKCAFRF